MLTRTKTKKKTSKTNVVLLNCDFSCTIALLTLKSQLGSKIKMEKLGQQINKWVYVTFIQQYCQGKFENTFL